MSRKPRAEQAEQEQRSATEGRFCYEGLDRVLHEKARLGILASLAANDSGLLFNDLKQLCSLTDGNLSRHLGVLSEAGLVETWKGTNGPRPQTMYRLTSSGRQRFSDYIGELERVVADAHSETRPATNRPRYSAGWSPA
jgi:DNA-binding MarR family transcriptional regulator